MSQTFGKKDFYPGYHIYNKDLASKIKSLAGMGITKEQAAAFLHISHETIQRYYNNDWEEGIVNINYRVAKSLYNKCMNGDTSAMIFWCKTRLRWSERQEIAQTTTATIDNHIQFSWADSGSTNSALKSAAQTVDVRAIESDTAQHTTAIHDNGSQSQTVQTKPEQNSDSNTVTDAGKHRKIFVCDNPQRLRIVRKKFEWDKDNFDYFS